MEIFRVQEDSRISKLGGEVADAFLRHAFSAGGSPGSPQENSYLLNGQELVTLDLNLAVDEVS